MRSDSYLVWEDTTSPESGMRCWSAVREHRSIPTIGCCQRSVLLLVLPLPHVRDIGHFCGAYRVALVVVIVLGPRDVDLGVVQVLHSVGSAQFLTSRVVIECVLDLVPVQCLVAAVLRQLQLRWAP